MLTSNDWALARQCTLLKELDPADIVRLIDANSVIRLARNQNLFSQGDPAKAAFLVIEGQVKLSRLAPDGGEAVVHVFGVGETFAEAAMFMGGRYPVTATAVTDARLVSILNARLRDQVLEKPETAFAMLASMAQHLKLLVAQIEQMKLLTTRQRAIQFLLDQSGLTEGAAQFSLPHDKALLAHRLGMKPETLSRALAELVRHGVHMNGSHVTIADVGHLSDLLSLE